MFEKLKNLFGETEEEQYKYLTPRVVALCFGLVLLLVALLLYKLGLTWASNIEGLAAAIIVVIWISMGWSIFRTLFGLTSVAACFTGNIIVGLVIFIAAFIGAYFGGIFVSMYGIIRYLILLKKRKGV